MLDREDRAEQLRAILTASCGDPVLRVPLRMGLGAVGIEYVETAYSRDRFGAGMATHIIAAGVIVGELKNECRHAGHKALLVEAAAWRKALIGAARPSNKQIAHWVDLMVQLSPSIRSTNEHTRDAIGVAIYAARHAAVKLYTGEQI
jgi:Holliday junction resolvasome RuvABC endonuclease subunit